MNCTVSYTQFTGDSYKDLAPADSLKCVINILRGNYDTCEENIVYACSFGADGIGLIDLVSKWESDTAVVFLDTEVHFDQTYELIERNKKRYPKFGLHT